MSHFGVAAIDIGTTFSTWAISLSHDFLKDPCNVQTPSWNSGSHMSSKTPTSLLIQPDGITLSAFGYDAEDKYMDLRENGKHKAYYFFQKFKIMLYFQRSVSRYDLLTAANGKKLPAIQVFQLAIRYLKDDLLKQCGKQVQGDLDANELLWTLTVPAIWTDQAKKFMREAAIKAGIDMFRLSIVLEPEAAACYCHYLPIEKSRDNGSLASMKPGSKYMIIDCGGGTTDICCHQILDKRMLKEVHRASGNAVGSADLDKAFEELLVKICRSKPIDKFKTNFNGDFVTLLRQFEAMKKTLQSSTTELVTLVLPSTLVNLLPSKDLEKAVKKALVQDKVKVVPVNKLRIEREWLITEIYKDVLGRVGTTVEEVFSHDYVRDIETVLLVGGFSESRLLQEYMKGLLPDKQIVVVRDASLAVVKGAAIYGHSQPAVQKRITRYTYGIGHFDTVGEKIPSGIKTYKNKDGVKQVKLFLPILEAGQEIAADHETGEVAVGPFKEDQPSVSSDIYAVDEKDEVPTYVDDPRCIKLGKISAPITDKSVPLEKREFLFKYKFGGTEILATALETATGKTIEATIDLLG